MQLMGIAEFIIGRAFARPVGSTHPGRWNEIPAVRHDRIVEIKSPLILQPGPAALTDGLDALAGIIAEWADTR